ncbi:MAG: hypothetical protein HY551_05465, partial [Elusimicrobia bacterium]|nr:hypothetical protein [Elusimicrobiota bacterium]
LTANLSGLRVVKTGALSAEHVTEIAFYYDDNNSGLFEANTDIKLATGTWDGTSWHFGNPANPFYQTPLNTVDPTRTSLSSADSSFKNFFLTLRLAATGYAVSDLPSSLGLSIPAPSYISLAAGNQVSVAQNNFEILTVTSTVQRQPASINVAGTDINAWWAPPSLPFSTYSYVNQGTTFAGALKLRMWTNSFTGTLGRVRVTHSGTGLDSDIKRVRLFIDSDSSGDSTRGDGVFQFSIDKEVTDSNSPVTFSSVALRTVDLVLKIDGGDPNNLTWRTITPSTNTYFVVFDYAPDAIPLLTHGAKVTSQDIVPLGGDGALVSFVPIASTNVVVLPTVDEVVIDQVNSLGAGNQNSVPAVISQNDADQPVAKFTMKTRTGSAVWSGLMLDRWLHSSQTGDIVLRNKASDVENIRVWLDSDGNGLLGAATDQIVSPLSSIIHNFPQDRLVVAISSTDAGPLTVRVTNIANFYPADDVFPVVPQRLVLGDDQTDESLKEVVACSGADFSINAFTGCQRALEGTAPLNFSTATVLSGPARVPIQGLGGGQSLGMSSKNYFISFDLAPLATVDDSANLGIAIPGTSYFLIQAPKQMSKTDSIGNAAIGIPPDGKTLSLISNVAEYADKLIVTATDTVDSASLGAFLQQRSTQTVLSFTVYADVADAVWRWAVVSATGSSAVAGNVGNDVQLVSLWRDQNDNGIFDGVDVMIATGTFGNSGQPLATQLKLSSPETIYTKSRAQNLLKPQRYFVAYTISPTATTTDPVTQLPRTLGALVNLASFPKNNPTVDDPNSNAFSLPNAVDAASPLPFIGKSRALIPSSQTMYVKATPVFSSKEGTFEAPRLPFSIPAASVGAVDAAWLVSSVQGLPPGGPTSYMVVDGEVISYEALSAGALVRVHRGLLNTSALSHSTDAALGPYLSQGSPHNAILKLEAWASAQQIQWGSVKLTVTPPTGLHTADSDIAAVKLWKSVSPSTGPAFHRNPQDGSNTEDAVLASGLLTQGFVTLTITDPALGFTPYTLITPSTQTFYVSIDINEAAKFSHAALSPADEVVVLSVVDATDDFALSPPGAKNDINPVGPIASPTYPLVPTFNTMKVTFASLASPFVPQASFNNLVARLTVEVDSNTVIWQKLRLDRTGSADSIDNDVTVVKVWRDADGNGIFDSADTARNSRGDYAHLISFGNESFSSGTVAIAFKTPPTVSTAPANFFVTFDISQFAKPGSSYGFRINDTGYFTVQVPHAVGFSAASFQSSPLMTVQEVSSLVTLGVNDLILTQNITRVVQAQRNVSMLRFNLATDVALASWKAIRLERSGGSQDEDKPFGRNTNVSFVRIWRDIDQSDMLDENSDLNISEVNTVLQSPIPAAQATPFAMVLGSTVGFPSGGFGRVYVSGAELMTFGGGYGSTFVGGVLYPTVTIVSRGDILGSGVTPVVAHAAGVNVRKVDLFDQTNDQNLQLVVDLANAQTLAPTAASFFVSFDIGATAVKNDAVGVNIQNRTWITVQQPKDTTPVVRVNVEKNLPLGTTSQAYPYRGTQVFISPLSLTISGRSIAPSAATGGQANIPLEQLTMNVNSDFVRIAQLRLSQLGTVQSPPVPGTARGDASRVSVWTDNGDGAFTPNTDRLIGAVIHAGYPGGSISFDNGLALVNLSVGGIPYLTVTTAPVTVFIAADLGSLDVTGRSTLGDQVGFSLENFNDMIGPNSAQITAAPDASVPTPLRLRSSLVQIAPAVIPLTRQNVSVTVASNGYPVYVKRDGQGNVLRDLNGHPVPDSGTWINRDGTPYKGLAFAAELAATREPLLDVNGDGLPDNFDFTGSGFLKETSLDGTGMPSVDMDGDGILDVDLNHDGMPDKIVDDGSGKPIFFLVDINDNSYPISDQGLAINSWLNNTTRISVSWAVPTSTVTGYQLAAGINYSTPTFFSSFWRHTGSSTTGTLDGLGLPVPKVVHLSANIGPSDTSISVEDTSGLAEIGKIFVGAEIIAVTRVSNTLLRVTPQSGCPGNSGRGCDGSLPQTHLKGESVSDQAIIVSVRGFTGPAGNPTTYIPSSLGRSLAIYRIDTTPPSAPGTVIPNVPPGTAGGSSYFLSWAMASDPESGAAYYELQERAGTDPVWHTIALIPAVRARGAINNSYQVGNSTVNVTERPRPAGQFFTYRVRAYNAAGLSSGWSTEGAAVPTTLISAP